MSNDTYYGVTRTNEYLAHYGIKGMKWGVRKAIASGNTKQLGRQYKKAQKKLAKLEARANNGKKYAKRATALGAGAAAAGTLAGVGTAGVSKALGAVGGAAAGGAHRLGGALAKSKNAKLRAAGSALQKASVGGAIGISKAGRAVGNWGNSGSGIQTLAGRRLVNQGRQNVMTAMAANKAGRLSNADFRQAIKAGQANVKAGKNMRLSNNTVARIGAAAVGAGLAGAAGYNAYRAATTKRAARKAAQFRSEMNKAFAGTQYGQKPRQGNKRRRSSRG